MNTTLQQQQQQQQCIILNQHNPKQSPLSPVALAAHHGVGLAAAGLPVREHADIVAVEGVLHNVLAEVGEDLALGDKVRVPRVVGPIRVVKGKAVRLPCARKQIQ
jgi:hypothetical protein